MSHAVGHEDYAHRRERGRFVGIGVWVLVLTVVGVAIGISVLNSLLLAGATVTLYGLRHLPYAETQRWPDRAPATDAGARRDVARLSWNLAGSEHRVDRTAVRRLRAIAERRLSEHGLALADDAAACRERVGEAAYGVLVSPESQRPLLTDFSRAVRAVEALTTSDAATGRLRAPAGRAA